MYVFRFAIIVFQIKIENEKLKSWSRRCNIFQENQENIAKVNRLWPAAFILKLICIDVLQTGCCLIWPNLSEPHSAGLYKFDCNTYCISWFVFFLKFWHHQVYHKYRLKRFYIYHECPLSFPIVYQSYCIMRKYFINTVLSCVNPIISCMNPILSFIL